MLELLEHQHRAALADHEAVAVEVERAAGAGRVVVARRHRAHAVEAADAHRRDGRLGAAGEHHVGHALADVHDGVADAIELAAQAVHDATSGPRVPSSIDTYAAPMLGISAGTQNGENRSMPFANRCSCAMKSVFSPPMPEPIERADAVGLGLDLEPRVGDGLAGGGDGEVRVAVGAARGLLVQVPPSGRSS